MRLQDPTAPYADVVANRRRERARMDDGEQFRLGVHDLQCLTHSEGADERTAVVGASSYALKPEQVMETLATIGKVGGLLTDMGFQVCPIGVLIETDRHPDLVVWVCGDETQADEYEQLAAIEAPGLSIGSCVDGLDTWSWLDRADLGDHDLDLITAVVTEIDGLMAAEAEPSTPDAGVESSTASSTVRPDTECYGQAQAVFPEPEDPSSRAQTGTERDGPERRQSGS